MRLEQSVADAGLEGLVVDGGGGWQGWDVCGGAEGLSCESAQRVR